MIRNPLRPLPLPSDDLLERASAEDFDLFAELSGRELDRVEGTEP